MAGGRRATSSPPDAVEANSAGRGEDCARQHRPFDQVTISVRAGLSLRSAPLGSDRRPLQGSREQVIADLLAFRDLGVASMLLETRYRDLDDMIGIYEAFAGDIRPLI